MNLMRFALVFVTLFVCMACDVIPPAALEVIQTTNNGFVFAKNRRSFIPWGFNYDHDWSGRLLEDYWTAELPVIAADFQEMKALNANVVRLHLQFGKMMLTPDQPNPVALERLEQVVNIAEQNRIYLLLTGLGNYKKEDVPAWYDALSESNRWAAQARFWQAVAARVGKSPAVFAYDLVNEPVIPDQPRPAGGWLTDSSFGNRYFVQYIVLDKAGRNSAAIARLWIQTMIAAIRPYDSDALITVGLLSFPNGAGFEPSEIVKDLDFLSVHVYPEEGKVAAALDLLGSFQRNKPVLVEETYVLNISALGLADFFRQSKSLSLASGWIGFYWGRTLAQVTPPKDIFEALMKNWLEVFIAENPNR